MERTDAPIQRHAPLLLEGGSEFTGRMEAARPRRAEGGRPETRDHRPGGRRPGGRTGPGRRNGVRWFKRLGAADVRSTGWVDRQSSRDAGIAATSGGIRPGFLPGGSPRYLAEALGGSLVWEAVLAAQAAGAVIGGSSAGAMVLCEVYYDPSAAQVLPGLNLVRGICMLPHHDTFGRAWEPQICP